MRAALSTMILLDPDLDAEPAPKETLAARSGVRGSSRKSSENLSPHMLELLISINVNVLVTVGNCKQASQFSKTCRKVCLYLRVFFKNRFLTASSSQVRFIVWSITIPILK